MLWYYYYGIIMECYGMLLTVAVFSFVFLTLDPLRTRQWQLKTLWLIKTLIFWLSLKLGCVLVTLMMLRLEPYVQMAIDFYMFRGVIPEAEVLVCYLRTLSK